MIDCFQVKVLIYRIRFPCNFTLHETPLRDQTREERIEAARCILEKCQRLGYDLKIEGEDTIVVYDAEWREVDRV
jgi:hypothetical protein